MPTAVSRPHSVELVTKDARRDGSCREHRGGGREKPRELERDRQRRLGYVRRHGKAGREEAQRVVDSSGDRDAARLEVPDHAEHKGRGGQRGRDPRGPD